MARTLCLLLAYAAVAQAAPQVVRVDPSPQRPLPRSPFSATFSRHPPPPFTGATHSLTLYEKKAVAIALVSFLDTIGVRDCPRYSDLLTTYHTELASSGFPYPHLPASR
jgi:hypothetical protein